MPISYSTIAYDGYLVIYFKYNNIYYYVDFNYEIISRIVSNNEYSIYRCEKVLFNPPAITYETEQSHHLKYIHQDYRFLNISIHNYFFASIIDKMPENFL